MGFDILCSMNENLVNISESQVQGNGLFAEKDFKKGDLVLDWNPKNKYLKR